MAHEKNLVITFIGGDFSILFNLNRNFAIVCYKNVVVRSMSSNLTLQMKNF